MRKWQALLRAFGQMKNNAYLHFDLSERFITLSEQVGHKEAMRWQRVKEDFKQRAVKVAASKCSVRPTRFKQVVDGIYLNYDVKATWVLEQRGKAYEQRMYEQRRSYLRWDEGWIVEEDEPLVEEGKAQDVADQKELVTAATGMKQGLAAPSELAGLYLRLPEATRGYDRQKAVSYAHRYWNSHNPKFKLFDVDCTNYVSQCLWAGGAPMTYRQSPSEGWWYHFSSPPKWSFSWTVAHALRWYLATSQGGLRAEEVADASSLQPGDVICYDFEGDGRFNHTTIVVAKDANNEPLVNAHTSNSQNRYWAYRDSTAWTPNIQYKFFRIIV